MKPQQFQKTILSWFDQHGRKHLPWQQNKTPYRVWISEIMLQQTQVSTVIPYYERFLNRFPDVISLANATEDDVLHLWTGLGYYSRARNLHRAAKIIVEEFAATFPNDLAMMKTLPGIGRSTAGAILSIAFQQSAPILDGNVKRVLTRFLAINEWPGEKKVTEQLWSFAEKYTPQQRTADYAQAMMDLGATICVRGKPLCEQCPLKKNCGAYLQGIEKTLPIAKPKKTLPIREATFLLIKNQERILLEKRPALGIWGGLWSLPEIKGHLAENEIRKFCLERYRLRAKNLSFSEAFRHTFSHFHLDILPVVISAESTAHKIMEDEQQLWYNINHSQAIGLPAPVKKLLRTTA